MIRNSFRIIRQLAATFLLSAPVALSYAQAPTDPPTPAQPPYANALRLDVGGILARNLAYNALNAKPQLLLPVLLGYERQLGPRISGNVEVLLNGGEPDERLAGVALQGRYYLYQGRKSGLIGMYAAPTLSFRSARQQFYYNFTTETRKLGGAGALLGAQLPLSSHLLLDVSGGIMTWTRLDNSMRATSSGYPDNKTYYERQKSVFDGRISLGYRF